MRWGIICLVTALAAIAPAYSHAGCWGDSADHQANLSLSCTRLTESLLKQLQGADQTEVIKAMGAPGQPGDPGWIHYDSNFGAGRRAGGGFVNFHFGSDGRVDTIEAEVNRAPNRTDMQYIWNDHVGGCSDFPDSRKRCN